MKIPLRGIERLMVELEGEFSKVERATGNGGELFAIIRGYMVVGGAYLGKVIDVAIKAPPDFPESPPVAFLVCPCIAAPGTQSVSAESHPFAPGPWQSWSRKVTKWNPEQAGKFLRLWLTTATVSYGK